MGWESGGSHLGERGVVGEEEDGVLEGGDGDGGDGMSLDDVESVLLRDRELIGMRERQAHNVLLLEFFRVCVDVVFLKFNATSCFHHEITLIHLCDGSLHNPHRVAYGFALEVILDLFQAVLIAQHRDAYSITKNT